MDEYSKRQTLCGSNLLAVTSNAIFKCAPHLTLPIRRFVSTSFISLTFGLLAKDASTTIGLRGGRGIQREEFTVNSILINF